eukprot:5174156-Lingulodinium_polyedra.AAC.1
MIAGAVRRGSRSTTTRWMARQPAHQHKDRAGGNGPRGTPPGRTSARACVSRDAVTACGGR